MAAKSRSELEMRGAIRTRLLAPVLKGEVTWLNFGVTHCVIFLAKLPKMVSTQGQKSPFAAAAGKPRFGFSRVIEPR